MKMGAAIRKPHLGFAPCPLGSTLPHVSASTASGVEGSSTSSPNHLNLFSRHCLFLLLVYLRLHQRVSLFLSVPDAPRKIFIRKYKHESRTRTYHTPATAGKRKKPFSSCLPITCFLFDFLINAKFLAANTFSINLDSICWRSLTKYYIGFHWFSWAQFAVNPFVYANLATHS